MILPEEGKILDLGCGYGPIGIAAAKFNPNLHVVMTDINRRAVLLAEKNMKLNKIANATVKQGSLYEPVENMEFEAILTNPPISSGMKTVTAIITDAPKHLKKKATLQLVVRSKIAGKRLPFLMKETFGNIEVLAKKGGYRILLSKN
jgi:16S rRNA G1207 methylase RsmC